MKCKEHQKCKTPLVSQNIIFLWCPPMSVLELCLDLYRDKHCRMAENTENVEWSLCIDMACHLEERSVSPGYGSRRTLGHLGQVKQHLLVVQGVFAAARLGEGNHNGTGVVSTQHALAPPQQSMADQLPGTGYPTRCLHSGSCYFPDMLQ